MMTVSILQDQEFYDDDINQKIPGSQQILIKNIDLNTFGLKRPNEEADCIPDATVVVRDPMNVMRDMNIDHIYKMADKYGF